MFKCSMAIKNDVVEEYLMTSKMFTESFICSTTSCQGLCLLNTKWICSEGKSLKFAAEFPLGKGLFFFFYKNMSGKSLGWTWGPEDMYLQTERVTQEMTKPFCSRNWNVRKINMGASCLWWGVWKEAAVLFLVCRMNQNPQMQDGRASHKLNQDTLMLIRTKLFPFSYSTLLRNLKKTWQEFYISMVYDRVTRCFEQIFQKAKSSQLVFKKIVPWVIKLNYFLRIKT